MNNQRAPLVTFLRCVCVHVQRPMVDFAWHSQPCSLSVWRQDLLLHLQLSSWLDWVSGQGAPGWSTTWSGTSVCVCLWQCSYKHIRWHTPFRRVLWIQTPVAVLMNQRCHSRDCPLSSAFGLSLKNSSDNNTYPKVLFWIFPIKLQLRDSRLFFSFIYFFHRQLS